MITTKQAFNISRQIHIPNKHANLDVLYGPYESINQARESVPEVLRERGLTVGIINSFNGKLLEYWWKDGVTDSDLVIKQTSSGGDENSIPIYTMQMVEQLNPQGGYITIPNKSDLSGEVQNFTYSTSENGQIANILFSALRQLQAEVARLKNSYLYGMNSYKNRDTAFSAVLSDYEDESEEPLWAIDPEGLSLLQQVSIDSNSDIHGRVYVDKNKLVIEEGTWESKTVSDIQDPKTIFYVTLSNSNVIFSFDNTKENDEVEYINLNLQQHVNDNSPQNIMLILSKKQENKGENYIYITSDNIETDRNIIKGYYNPSSNQIQNSKYVINGSLSFNQISLSNTNLSNLSVYSKYQDFSKEVIPSKPNSKYKYDVAHITIRSVDDYQTLKDIVGFLQDDELVYCKGNRSLYIVDNGQIQIIGSKSSSPDDGTDDMSDTQILNKLESLGILYNDDSKTLKLNDISDITFINDDTGYKYNFKVDAYGNLKGNKVPNITETLAKQVEGKTFNDTNVRGFVATLANFAEGKSATADFKLNSDRVKIGAVYAPSSSDIIHGCTHGYIELENTSDKNFPLDGCYIHCARTDKSGNDMDVVHLALDGYVPAGGTYLIRCKQYAYEDDSNVFIKVNTFDKEWYVNGQLLDLTLYQNTKLGLALTYGYENLKNDDILVSIIQAKSNSTYTSAGLSLKDDSEIYTYPYAIHKSLIDSIYIGNAYTTTNGSGIWAASSAFTRKSNCIYKNMFELDPAKQAFQAFTLKDSSRVRWGWSKGNSFKTATDYQYLTLNNEFIEFPNSDEKYPVSKFTPKASFEHKNVCTDKTKLDLNKPNMVTCSFGINIYTTRCFNWISAGLFDEYVFIKNLDNGKEWTKIASYGQTESDSRRKQFNQSTLDAVYNRISRRFPADNTLYTSHKCIIELSQEDSNPKTYTYVVGRALKDGTPDFDHCSEEYTFTLYPDNYTPRIYQITDQQGFHWIEYQVWAAVAKKVNEQIENDKQENVIPILINTGDMTQNGTRINEWLDYYNAGKCLFNHLEQMNVVGNNDLCGTDVDKLGTGDDPGKSNSFYFHLFYCYEISELPSRIPIINGKYIPSLYYFDSINTRYLMVNSEIKDTNCSAWFNLKSNNNVVNIYTGYDIPATGDPTYVANTLNFNPIYNQIYNICYEVRNESLQDKKEIIGVCHELPFTVITTESIGDGNAGDTPIKSIPRSVSNDTKLVGSHLNQLNPQDRKGTYWFSRLMEYFGVRLIIGGHKHTYACTYPLRENYYYKDSQSDEQWKNSRDNGPKPMSSSLETDIISFVNPNDPSDQKNLTKFPLTKRKSVTDTSIPGVFLPYEANENLTGGIIYFMCQASGYKLTSNKELPTKLQKFSQIIPETNYDPTTKESTANSNQKYPMFSVISQNLVDNEIKFNIKLIRVEGIFSNDYKFTQSTYNSGEPSFKYLTVDVNNDYGTWGSADENLIENI